MENLKVTFDEKLDLRICVRGIVKKSFEPIRSRFYDVVVSKEVIALDFNKSPLLN